MNHSIIELFARPYFLPLQSNAATMQTPRCTQRGDRSCKVIYRGRKKFVRRMKEPGRSTLVSRGTSPCFTRDEDTGKLRRSTGFPVFSTCFRSTVSQPVLSIAKPRPLFPVRVMRSKLGETSREATDATWRSFERRQGDRYREEREKKGRKDLG